MRTLVAERATNVIIIDPLVHDMVKYLRVSGRRADDQRPGASPGSSPDDRGLCLQAQRAAPDDGGRPQPKRPRSTDGGRIDSGAVVPRCVRMITACSRILRTCSAGRPPEATGRQRADSRPRRFGDPEAGVEYPSARPSLRLSEAPERAPVTGSIMIAWPPPINARCMTPGGGRTRSWPFAISASMTGSVSDVFQHHALAADIAEARRVDRLLQIQAAIHQIDQHLHMSLRLDVAAHHAIGHQEPIVLEDHRGNQRVKRPFARRELVGMTGLEREASCRGCGA